MLRGKQIVLIVSGGIAAYKAPDLVRRLRERGAQVRCAMTEAAARFIGPTTLAAVSGNEVASNLFDEASGLDVGHIRIAREADLILVAPATADFIARLAHGLADDLSTAIVLARSGPVMIAPAMNPKMWSNPATERNVALLRHDGLHFVGPECGEMAEAGEAGLGRMAEPSAIAEAAAVLLHTPGGALAGLRFVVTSGPTQEPLDPVRFVSNRSSGKQGHAIAGTLARAGATVTLVSGPVSIPAPAGVDVVPVETAGQMLSAVTALLPVDGAVFAAAVSDWRSASVADRKMKKSDVDDELVLRLVRNPDILATVAHHALRPRLVVGFAAETNDLIANAEAKLGLKGADWILANDVSPASGVFGGDHNHVVLLADGMTQDLGAASKIQVAETIVARIVAYFGG